MVDKNDNNKEFSKMSSPTGGSNDSKKYDDKSEDAGTEQIESGIGTDVESEIRNWALNEMPENPYHNRDHVENILDEVDDLSVSDGDKEVLRLAAYFHDIGYREGAKNHEERSAKVAIERLSNAGYDDRKIDNVSDAIRDTELFKKPETRLGAILSDIDTHNFSYDWDEFKQTSLTVKEEQNPDGSTHDWWESTLQLLEAHSYHSEIGQKRYTDTKQATIEKLSEKISDD